NLLNLTKVGQSKYKEILSIINSEKQVPKNEVEAVLAELKATDPIFNAMADKIAVLISQKEALLQQILSLNDKIQKLNSQITISMLSMDGLNRSIADANNVMDDRVNVYLDHMESRARERLLKYHYFLKKAYE